MNADEFISWLLHSDWYLVGGWILSLAVAVILCFTSLDQIDQEFRRGQAKGQHRHQALTTGNHLGISVPGGEQTDGLGNRRGRGIFKNRRLHPVSHQYVMHRLTVFIT